MSECEGCGEARPVIYDGLCVECIRAEVCCSNRYAAALALCGCGGWAAEALDRIRESA